MSSELNTLKGYNRPLAFKTRRPNFNVLPTEELKDVPESIDWRTKGVVSDVRNQGGCGSCWAFSAVAVLESHIAIQTGKLLALSEQQMVDCTPNPKHCGGTGGCEGATQPLGFEYVTNIGGAISRDLYKYTARDGKCQDGQAKLATIGGYTSLATNDYNALMLAVGTQGPVSISVAADAWFSYSSGIYNGKCGATINHAVVAVGYGADATGKKYWIVRNSWGTGWGEKGHIRLHREDTAKDVKCEIDYSPASGSGCDGGPSQITVCGICGMYVDSSIPYGGKLI
jgi:cathepsin L